MTVTQTALSPGKAHPQKGAEQWRRGSGHQTPGRPPAPAPPSAPTAPASCQRPALDRQPPARVRVFTQFGGSLLIIKKSGKSLTSRRRGQADRGEGAHVGERRPEHRAHAAAPVAWPRANAEPRAGTAGRTRATLLVCKLTDTCQQQAAPVTEGLSEPSK